jgi:hypothetical protein
MRNNPMHCRNCLLETGLHCPHMTEYGEQEKLWSG